MKINILLAALLLSACNKPDLPDPRAAYPLPPAELMVPPQKMETIPQ